MGRGLSEPGQLAQRDRHLSQLDQPDVEGTLDLLRLMQATGALTSAGDYAMFIDAAAEQGNFIEAQAVLDAGIAAKLVDPRAPQFRDIDRGLKAKPKATAADLADSDEDGAERHGAAAHRRPLLRRSAIMPRRPSSIAQSMGKPGADADLANLHIGMALARAGDKAGATAALNAVTGPRADIAKFWLIYVQQQA